MQGYMGGFWGIYYEHGFGNHNQPWKKHINEDQRKQQLQTKRPCSSVKKKYYCLILEDLQKAAKINVFSERFFFFFFVVVLFDAINLTA